MLFVLGLLLLLFFYREILFLIIRWIGHGRLIDAGPAIFRLQAALKRAPKLFLLKPAPLESIILETSLSQSLWVAEELWEILTASERECLLIWAHSQIQHASAFSRLLGFSDPRLADRDTIVLAADPLSLISALEKAQAQRAAKPPSSLGTLLSGLSLLGPPLLNEGLSMDERRKAYVDQLTRLKK